MAIGRPNGQGCNPVLVERGGEDNLLPTVGRVAKDEQFVNNL
jgi:hypothetical protein